MEKRTGTREDTSGIRQRMNELLGFIKGIDRDTSPEGLSALAALREQWESMGARNLEVAKQRRSSSGCSK